jgi:hypothetical protein
MNETKWTPRPWKVIPLNHGHGALVQSGVFGAGYAYGESFSIQFSIPNAHLIAAAPDLYEALDLLAKCEPLLSDGDPKLTALRLHCQKMLAKARGEQS